MLINKETPRVGNAMLPRDLYVVRCLTSKFSLSKAGNPMTTLECEVVSEKNGVRQPDTDVVVQDSVDVVSETDSVASDVVSTDVTPVDEPDTVTPVDAQAGN